MSGLQGYTAVGGRKMFMEKGDLLLTTQYDWHDHGNEGDEPVIWLDGLDMPLFSGSFPVNFQIRLMDHPDSRGQRYHESTATTTSPTQYKWSDMKANLLNVGKPHARLEYINKDFADGHISRTMAAFAEYLEAGSSSALQQETCNNIYHVVEGSGETVVSKEGQNVEQTVLKWSAGDTFCIPSWYKFEHTSSADSPAFLFNYNDLSMLEKLGFYRSA
jgi:gentisate 1,2-dioxygenase